jgi:hypothetical protein
MPFNNLFFPSMMDYFRRKNGMGMTPFNSDSPDDSVDPSQPDFASQWAKISGAHPNYDRLQQLVTQGAPVVQPTKMNRLGAILAAGSAGADNPIAGIEMGRRMLQDPQDRATQTYQSQVKNLGGLANMESDQMQKELESLKFNEDLYFKNQNAENEKKRLGYEGDRTTADVARSNAETEKMNWEPYTNTDTGMKEERNVKTGAIRTIGKVADTSEEKLADFKKQEQAKIEVDRPEKIREEGVITQREKDLEASRAASSLTNINAGIEGRKSVADANNKAKADRQAAALVGKAGKASASDKNKQVYLDLADAVSNNPKLSGLNLDDYITEDPTTHIIRVKPSGGFIGDGPEDIAIKEELKNILGTAYAKAGSGGKGGGPGTKPPPSGFSLRKGPG